MNILMSTNDTTYPGVELVIYTLLTHNKHCNIYIMTMDVEVKHPEGVISHYIGLHDDQKEKLRKIVKYLDSTSNICFIDAYDTYMEYLTPSPNETSGFTPYATLRLVADILLPEVDHILYLDADVAITGDISGVYYDYVNRRCNYAAWSARDACNGEGEMVSGVMLINLDVCRSNGFFDRARANYKKNLYRYPDQMAIRDAGNPIELPENFGFCNILEECEELPLIIHFTNQISPKIYCCNGKPIVFYRRFPFLKYVKEGLKLLDTINI